MTETDREQTNSGECRHDWIHDGVMGTAPKQTCVKCGVYQINLGFSDADFERMAEMESDPIPTSPKMIAALETYFELLKKIRDNDRHR